MSKLDDLNEAVNLPAPAESPPGVPLWLKLLAVGLVLFLIVLVGRHFVGGSMGHM